MADNAAGAEEATMAEGRPARKLAPADRERLLDMVVRSLGVRAGEMSPAEIVDRVRAFEEYVYATKDSDGPGRRSREVAEVSRRTA
jgi:hypothetical protein